MYLKRMPPLESASDESIFGLKAQSARVSETRGSRRKEALANWTGGRDRPGRNSFRIGLTKIPAVQQMRVKTISPGVNRHFSFVPLVDS